MLLLQTAFDQEFAAVMAAGSRVADAIEPTIEVAGRSCMVLMTGIGPRAAHKALAAMLDRIEPPELVLSIGLAGGLKPTLKFGEVCLIGSVARPSVARPSVARPSVARPSQAVLNPVVSNEDSTRPEKAVVQDSARPEKAVVQDSARPGKAVPPEAVPPEIHSNLERLSSNLRERLRVHSLVTIPAPALTAQSKRQLAEQTLAALCDMETYAIADECQRRQLPWIGARVVSDAAGDNIPGWIMRLPRLIEQKRWLRLLGRVATHPQDLPSLIRLALRMQRLKPILTQLTTDLVTHVLPA